MADSEDKCPGCGAPLKELEHVQGTTCVTHYYECGTVDCRNEWPFCGIPLPCTNKSAYVGFSKECYRRQLVAAKTVVKMVIELARLAAPLPGNIAPFTVCIHPDFQRVFSEIVKASRAVISGEGARR